MGSQSAVSARKSSPRTLPCWENEEYDVEAAFIYAADSRSVGTEMGYVDSCGDIYGDGDHKVGHVTAAVNDGGEIYRGYDDRLGYVRIVANGDGFIYADTTHNHLLRGVVTTQGDVYRGRYARKVGIVKPQLDVKRMGAAVLLLGLLETASPYVT